MLKAAFALVCAVARCCAQNDAPTSPETTPVAKEVTASSTQTPASAQTPPAPVPAPADATQTNPAATAPPTAAAPAKTQAPPTPKPAADGKPSAAKDTAGRPGTKAPYVLGPLDVISVKVWNNPNLSSPLDVGSDGMISLPLVGQIKADGLTKEQLKEALVGRLGEFLNNPEVDVQVLKVNSKRYFVYGGVGRPGEYPLVEDTTIMDALSNTGGFKDFANKKKIYVLRGTQKFTFNYQDVSKGKHMEENIQLQNGDRIFVPE
jgi:polysaccharide export outer membrane protein